MKRAFIAAGVTWPAAVLLFVWAAEPFGPYIGPDRWTTVWKLIALPYLIAAIFWAVYKLTSRLR